MRQSPGDRLATEKRHLDRPSPGIPVIEDRNETRDGIMDYSRLKQIAGELRACILLPVPEKQGVAGRLGGEAIALGGLADARHAHLRAALMAMSMALKNRATLALRVGQLVGCVM
jgi:hypothetical protein